MGENVKKGAGPIRVRDQICFTVFAIVDSTPEKVRVRDHLFPYEGMKSEPGLVWGLYGTTSINAGLFLAEDYARSKRKMLLTINMWYHVPLLELTRQHLTEESALASGYLHLGRVTHEFREELLLRANAWAKKNVDASARILMSELSLDDFVRRYPGFIRHLMKENPEYNMIIHPVQQSYDIEDQRKLWVATVRAVPEHFKRAEVRFMPSIPVEI